MECSEMKNLLHKGLTLAAGSMTLGMSLTRMGLIVVLVWIGALKIYKYEADGIVPFVANSPFMSFFYKYNAPDYTKHVNPEGAVVPANRAWHEGNHTYPFALGLGAVLVVYGLMIGLNPWLPQVAALGSALVVIMSFVTLSFLITTPESWVPDLGGPEQGFPLLSARGRLVVKDAIMLGAAWVTMADSAARYLRSRS
ncbi:putative membrane protein YkgB [Roseimicrobium gellanilyticum]|uniref:Putative membrane protein YkgB n=2 Tax=Roseimicrobium gellanilyticum TaxID=748857 RepID=A0A366H9P2_9BACT|nr:putative membrane protein YkgB [Roseimicrobium gellanilyticum]